MEDLECPIGSIYQETKKPQPQAGSLSFWIKAIQYPPLLFLLDGGVKKQSLVSIRPGEK